MKQNPKNITTEIIRDYPTRFYLDETELRRLVKDIEDLLKEGAKKPKIKYWVGLENGIFYETTNFDTVIAEENSRSLTIRLLIIFAEIDENGDNLSSRRIIVHFSRGRIQSAIDRIHLDDDWFNLNFEGISYRIKDRTRDATLKSIKALEDRLIKFKRRIATIKFSINLRSLNRQLPFLVILGFLLYSLYALLDIEKNPRFSLFLHTQIFIGGMAIGILIVISSILLLNTLLLFLNWLIPPTVIAIGDEITQSKKNQKLREYIFWSVIIATIIGVGVNLIIK